MPKKIGNVYIACPSADMGRAKRARRALLTAGVLGVADWIEGIEAVGHANPGHVSRFDRVRWALQDLELVARAGILWFLRPADGQSSHGGYYEMATARATGKIVVVSGVRSAPSIFDALADVEVDDDETAYGWICRYYGRVVAPLEWGGTATTVTPVV